MAMEVFRFQAERNPVYSLYLQQLNKRVSEVKGLTDIPFLPISFFKTKRIITDAKVTQEVFTSSGTGKEGTSKHYVADLKLYEQSFLESFKKFYGPVEDYCVLALLPSYLERTGSSLVYMTENMIELSEDPDSGFYLDDHQSLHQVLLKKIEENAKVLLLGVSFGLLDFAESFQLPKSNLIVMETGGMKGRRKEMIREEVHAILTSRLGVKTIHSEYGMTEILSQAYSTASGLFRTPAWMKVMVRDTDDPFSYALSGKTGGINIVDLANIDSCSFVETQDLGRIHKSGEFEVLGRFDNSDIRGCNLMVI